ncbi:hypothetical protein C0993_009604, partial [Termitomyces sp. T159_Od127]
DQRSLDGFGFTQKKTEAPQVIDMESLSLDDASEVELSDFKRAELPGLSDVEMKSAGSDVDMISIHSDDQPEETEINLDPTDKSTSDIEL